MKQLVVYFYPLGTYASTTKIKNYSKTGSKCFVQYTFDKVSLRAFSRYRYNQTSFLNYCYDSVYEVLQSFYEMDSLQDQCSWACYTARQAKHMQTCSTNKVQPSSTLLQREQGKILNNLLSKKIDDLLENYDLERFLSKLKMSFLEFEKIYMEYNGLKH